MAIFSKFKLSIKTATYEKCQHIYVAGCTCICGCTLCFLVSNSLAEHLQSAFSDSLKCQMIVVNLARLAILVAEIWSGDHGILISS